MGPGLDGEQGRNGRAFGVLGQQLREKAQPQWQEAYAYRGKGTTYDRKMKVEGIYERWAPIPTSEGDEYVQEFIEELKGLVTNAIDTTRTSLDAQVAEESSAEG